MRLIRRAGVIGTVVACATVFAPHAAHAAPEPYVLVVKLPTGDGSFLLQAQLGLTEANPRTPVEIDIYGGDDFILGSPGKDVIHGDDGNDLILGGGNDDKLYGDNGNDVLQGGNGADDLSGGAGLDTVSYRDKKAGVQVSVNGTANDGNGSDDNGTRRDNVKTDVEIVKGSLFADTLRANPSVFTALAGAGGIDTYYAQNGHADLITCDRGDVVFRDASDVVTGC